MSVPEYDYLACTQENLRDFSGGKKISEDTKAVLCNAMASLAIAQELRSIRELLARKL